MQNRPAWRRFVVWSCSIIAVVLLANLTVLLYLRPIVLAQGLPKDIDQYTGATHSFEVEFYGRLANIGFFLVLPHIAVMLSFGTNAARSGQGRFRVFGIVTVCVAVVLVFATPYAGFLWAGYGW